MVKITDDSLVFGLACCLGAFSCVTRLSMAFGQFFQALAVLLGFVLFIRHHADIHYSREIKKYMAVVLIFFCSTLPAALFTGNPLAGMGAFAEMWIWRFTVFILIVTFIKKRSYLINMLTAFLAFFSVDCLVAVYQWHVHLASDGRGWGFGSNTLAIAGIMCMVLPMAITIACDSRFEQRLRNVAKASILCVIMGLLANQSRAAWLACMITTVVSLSRYAMKKKKIFLSSLAVIILCIGFFGAHPAYVQRLESSTNVTTNESNLDRLRMWGGALEMYKTHPVTGVGLNGFKPTYKEYAKSHPEIKHTYSHAHNNFMHLLAETGTPGVLGYVFFVFYFLIISGKNWLKNKNPYDLIILTSVIGFMLLFGQVEYIIDNSSAIRLFWYVLAIMLQLKAIEGKAFD